MMNVIMSVIMMSVVTISVIMMNVIVLSVIILSVVAPLSLGCFSAKFNTKSRVDSNDKHTCHFIFFATYEWAQYARVLVPCKPFQPCEI
jgi:hypothetical protein